MPLPESCSSGPPAVSVVGPPPPEASLAVPPPPEPQEQASIPILSQRETAQSAQAASGEGSISSMQAMPSAAGTAGPAVIGTESYKEHQNELKEELGKVATRNSIGAKLLESNHGVEETPADALFEMADKDGGGGLDRKEFRHLHEVIVAELTAKIKKETNAKHEASMMQDRAHRYRKMFLGAVLGVVLVLACNFGLTLVIVFMAKDSYVQNESSKPLLQDRDGNLVNIGEHTERVGLIVAPVLPLDSARQIKRVTVKYYDASLGQSVAEILTVSKVRLVNSTAAEFHCLDEGQVSKVRVWNGKATLVNSKGQFEICESDALCSSIQIPANEADALTAQAEAELTRIGVLPATRKLGSSSRLLAAQCDKAMGFTPPGCIAVQAAGLQGRMPTCDEIKALDTSKCSTAELKGIDGMKGTICGGQATQLSNAPPAPAVPAVPTLLTCANDPSFQKSCSHWEKKGLVERKCSLSWAPTKCAKTCGACNLCLESDLGAWGEWSACSASCGGGGRTRSRDPGTCTQGPFTESEQCNLQSCKASPCVLKDSAAIVIRNQDNAVIENLKITSSGTAPGISVEDSKNVTIRNVQIFHAGHPRVGPYGSGVGIHFHNSPNIKIEDVKVEFTRINGYLKDANPKCASTYCGPLPKSMAASYNIRGDDSPGARLYNVHVIGGSSGVWMKNCQDSLVSHFKAENPHGANFVGGRGQCLQVVYSDRFILEDFYCFVDNDIGFTEDTINIWTSHYSTVRRGFIEGGNGPNGVGLIMEKSSHGKVEDIDVTHYGNGAFSAYGAEGDVFMRCRAKSNHGLYKSCMSGRGQCTDWEGTNHCDGDDERYDERGNIWYAGDYNANTGNGQHEEKSFNNKIVQGQIYDITGWHKTRKRCESIGLEDWELNGAANSKAWALTDVSVGDFTLRSPYVPIGCAA